MQRLSTLFSGSLVGYFDINGNVDEVELNQERPLSPFMLNTTSREIILTEPLDFEKNQTYQVKAKCRQKNPTFQVTIFMHVYISVNCYLGLIFCPSSNLI